LPTSAETEQPSAGADPPSVFKRWIQGYRDQAAAFQQQLGLKLESTKAPVEVLVIDKVEKPSEN
jgi:uncharacterized protein (TIGR03435 family)